MSTENSLSPVDLESSQTGWHAMRAEFHALVRSIPPDLFKSRTLDTRWSIAEILTHMIMSIELIPQEIESVRQGKDFLNVPPLIATTVNLIWVRMRARKATPQSIIDSYDRAFKLALEAWDKVNPADWAKGANFFGEGYRTLAENYSIAITHFHEHAGQIRDSLPNTARLPHNPLQQTTTADPQ